MATSMPSLSTLMNSQLTLTSNSSWHSFFQINSAWSPWSVSTPLVLSLGLHKGQCRDTLQTSRIPQHIQSILDLLHDAQTATCMMGTPHSPIVETHPILFGLQTRTSCPLIKEMQGDKCKEPRCPTPEATPMEHALAELFDNELDCLLLIINFMQTRTRILRLIDELGTLTRRLQDI